MSANETIQVCGEVERRTELGRETFLLEYERKRPVVVRAARAPEQAWTPTRLLALAGEAPLELLDGVYDEDARAAGFARARTLRTTLRAYVEALLAGSAAGYLFNTESGVFLTRSDAPEFQSGWGRAANPGLAALAAAFARPSFLRPDNLVYATLILGGPAQQSPLHYDLGGEAKALVQLAGRKQVLLFAPSEAGFLSYPSWFEEDPAPFRVPHAADVSLDRPDPTRFPRLREARALTTVLEPGDVLYWPSFWSHHLRNLDPFTLAVSVTLEELLTSPMHLRETLGHMALLFRRMAGDPRHAFDLTSRAGIGAALQRLEAELFSAHNRGRSTMWSWHCSLMHE